MENNDYYEPTIRTSREKKEAHLYYNLTSSKESWRKETLQLRKEKQQLISFLEDKIKKCDVIMQMSIDSLNDKFADKKDEENVRRTLKITIRECEIEIKAFQEILDFVRGGKNE